MSSRQVEPLVKLLLGQRVTVDTSLGPCLGLLRRVGRSAHGGFGSLLLEAYDGSWLLIKSWLTIKRKT
jgi:hypothetical protein